MIDLDFVLESIIVGGTVILVSDIWIRFVIKIEKGLLDSKLERFYS